MKSIVIPVKADNKGNKELVYAIRSLEKNLKGFGDIWIIGKKITSLKGLKYIHCEDDIPSRWKERNIFRKIKKACEHPEVSENFVFLNDDHLLLEEFDIENLPFYHKGELYDTMTNNTGDYRKSLNHTRKYLIEKGKPTLDYDTHFPVIYNKQNFLNIFADEAINWERPFGYVIKSLYCNSKSVEGEFGGDCKIHRKMTYNELKAKISGKKFFSTSDGSMNEDMIKLLNELYPNKSIYER